MLLNDGIQGTTGGLAGAGDKKTKGKAGAQNLGPRATKKGGLAGDEDGAVRKPGREITKGHWFSHQARDLLTSGAKKISD